MIPEAKRLAEKSHQGQFRKFENTPFVQHPIQVARILKSAAEEATKEMVAAALLHDTVEDTGVTHKQIRSRFGARVAKLVKELTTDKEKRDEYGKSKYLGWKMANMSDSALTIKLCDRYHNVRKIEETPKKFRKRYSKETRKTILILLRRRTLTFAQRRIVKQILQKV